MAIRTSELYKDEGTIQKAIEEWETLGRVYGEAIEKMQSQTIKISANVEKFTGLTEDSREQLELQGEAVEKIVKEYDKYVELTDRSNVAIQGLKKAQKDLNRLHRLEAKLLVAKEGSYDKLSAQYSVNKIKLNAMSKEEREAERVSGGLVDKTRELYEEMKRLQEETGKHTLSVGDYKKAFEGLPAPIGGAVGQLESFGENLKKLAKNPAILVIGGLIGTALALGKAFTKSVNGAKLQDRVTARLQGTMLGLTKVTNDTAEAFRRMFKNGAAQGFKNLAKEAGEFFSFSRVGGGNNKAKEYFLELFGFIDKAGEALEEINRLTRENIVANTEAEKSISEVALTEEYYKSIVDDITKSFAEREKAGVKVRAATEERAKLEQEIAQRNYDLITQEVELRKEAGEDVTGILQSQADAYVRLKDAEREYTLAVRENERDLAELKQDRLERDLDILIDGYDNQKTNNERLIADETLSLKERRRILDETVQLGDESFKRQIETVQQFTDETINANDLINESDAVALNAKIRSLGLSEIMEGRLLEIIRDRKTATVELAQANRQLDASEAAQLRQDDAAAREEKITKLQQTQELEESKFNIVKRTEIEKQAFKVKQEMKYLKAMLQINDDLTDEQVQAIKNKLQSLGRELAEIHGGRQKSLFDLLNIDVSEKQLEGLTTAFQAALTSVQDFFQKSIELSQARVEASNAAVASAENELQVQLKNRELGYSDEVDYARKQLELARRTQDEALQQQREAQQNQILLDGILQTSNLITASTKIWSQLGFPFALPAIGIMWGSFLASKARALQLTKELRSEGAYDVIEGGSHASGRDTFLGYMHNGKPVYGERGEGHAVIDKATAAYYGHNYLRGIYTSLKNRTFEDDYINSTLPGGFKIGGGKGISMSRSEGFLGQLVQQGKNAERSFKVEPGVVIKKGNRTTRYV